MTEQTKGKPIPVRAPAGKQEIPGPKPKDGRSAPVQAGRKPSAAAAPATGRGPAAILARQSSEDPAARGATTAQYPCICPGEKYPITRAVCLARQARNYDRCLQCTHLLGERRPRRSHSGK